MPQGNNKMQWWAVQTHSHVLIDSKEVNDWITRNADETNEYVSTMGIIGRFSNKRRVVVFFCQFDEFQWYCHIIILFLNLFKLIVQIITWFHYR